jgi:hypothetical protein
MCDAAENLAGAGTDVRRCPDALGPRKNLHLLLELCYPKNGYAAEPKYKGLGVLMPGA